MESLSHCFWDISQRVTAYPLAGCFESQAAIYDRASWDLLWQTNVAIIYIFRIKLRKKKPYWQQPLWPGRQRQEDPQQGGLNFKQAVEPLFNFFFFFFTTSACMLKLCWCGTPEAGLLPAPPLWPDSLLISQVPLNCCFGIQQRQCVYMHVSLCCALHTQIFSVSPRFELLRQLSSELRVKKWSIRYILTFLLHCVCSQQHFQLIWCDLSDGLWGDLIKIRWNFNDILNAVTGNRNSRQQTEREHL